MRRPDPLWLVLALFALSGALVGFLVGLAVRLCS